MTFTPEVSTTTRLVHRGGHQEASWWHTAAVCDLPGAYDEADLLTLVETLADIKKLGFQALLLRLSIPDVKQQRPQLAALVKRAHCEGLRVLVRIGSSPVEEVVAPADSPPLLELDNDARILAERTRVVLAAGVDGVDLGMIDDAPHEPDGEGRAELFTQTVNQQLAELVDLDSAVILTAEATRANPEFFERHVTEDWFHHLRDDALFDAPWEATRLRRRIQQKYASHDPLGQAIAWRPSLGGQRSMSPRQRGIRPGSWEDGASPQRIDAMMMFVASLPGAIYLPFLQSGGIVWVTSTRPPELRLAMGKEPHDRFRRGLTDRVLSLRQQKKLASGSLAFVDGLDWANEGVSVHLSGHVMVVLNASDRAIEVPAEHTVLLYSDGFVSADSEATVVEPDTCAWFIPAQHQPVDPAHYR